VHDLAHGRLGVRCHLDEVEVGVIGQLACIVDADDTDLFATRADEPDLGNANPVVDASLSADENS
jgi:hypothetical protein